MNKHCDEFVSFSYSTDLLLAEACPSVRYSFQRGDFFFSFSACDKVTWESRKFQIEQPIEVPPHAIVKNGIGIPGGKIETSSVNRYGFSGLQYLFHSYGIDAGYIGSQMDMLLERGGNRLIGMVSGFDEETLRYVDDVLQSIKFNGEPDYDPQSPKTSQSSWTGPYTVDLARFFASPGSGRPLNVSYAGDSISKEQTVALAAFAGNQEQLSLKTFDCVAKYHQAIVRPTQIELSKHISEIYGAAQGFACIENASDVRNHVRLMSVRVHQPRTSKDVPIGLTFSCEWDPEHGLGVRFAGDTLETVGTDEVSLMPELIHWQPHTESDAAEQRREPER